MSPTTLQSEAARINGALSTGPVTAEGKATASMNALKHGLCSKQVVLPGEDQAAYDHCRADYIKSFQPRNQAEHDLVKSMVDARWRLNRLIHIEANLLASANDPKEVLKSLSLLTRYENQLNRTYDKAFKYFMTLRANLPAPAQSIVRNEPRPMSKTEAELRLHAKKFSRVPMPGGKENLALRL